jgi:hypothetical protein
MLDLLWPRREGIIKINQKMANRVIVLMLIAFLTTRIAFCQTTFCGTIHKVVDTSPTYVNGTSELFKYYGQELAPIVYSCSSQGKDPTTKLLIVLTIDSEGKVIDAVFSRHHLTDDCIARLKTKLLTMIGWTAGQLNKKNVCSNYSWIITCFKWG